MLDTWAGTTLKGTSNHYAGDKDRHLNMSFYLKNEAGNPGPCWKKYISRCQNLITAIAITDKTRQQALLPHYTSKVVHDILNMLDNTEEGQDSLNTIRSPPCGYQPMAKWSASCKPSRRLLKLWRWISNHGRRSSATNWANSEQKIV